jgi:hypothetical protein
VLLARVSEAEPVLAEPFDQVDDDADARSSMLLG